ncbi:MAG: RdgB/HAM1 family non-canonical purine NTP pyrophosphatase [Balneolaceae bacterium]
MKKPDKLFLASGNGDKITEFRQILRSLEIELTSTLDLEASEEVDEDQPTLEGNALKKARFWKEKTGLPALSDDTGLEVDALGGAPGVFSARYAGEQVTYEENVRKLLEDLRGAENRKARFRTVIALVGEEEWLFEGVCEGVILDASRGQGGFGYDPVFLPDGSEQTFAEMSSSEKNAISHRGRALQEFMSFLRSETG